MNVPAELETKLRESMRSPLRLIDILLESVAVLALLVPVAYVMALWPDLPARIPTHFNGAGAPDGFGPRSSVWWLVATQVGFFGLLTGLRYLSPRYWNVPFTVTTRNVSALGAILARFARALKCVTGLLLAALTMGTVNVALGRSAGLDPWWLGGSVVAMVVVGVWFWLALRRANRT